MLLLGSQPRGFIRNAAGLRYILQRLVQCRPQPVELLRAHESLQSLEELALFFADMTSQFLPEVFQGRPVETAGGRAREITPQNNVFSEKFLYQRLHLGKPRRSRKQFFFFRREVDSNLALKLFSDLRLPCLEINRSRLNRTVKAHA